MTCLVAMLAEAISYIMYARYDMSLVSVALRARYNITAAASPCIQHRLEYRLNHPCSDEACWPGAGLCSVEVKPWC